MSEQLQLNDLEGLICSIVTHDHVDDQFSSCWSEMRAHHIKEGFEKIEYVKHRAPFVEAGRDAMASHALQHGYKWLCYIDADMVFRPAAVLQLLHDAFVRIPQSDAIGAYCTLKGNYLPTIDTGTGTWEPHFPRSGVMEVIRTGGAFLLLKAHAFMRFGPPWFRTRIANEPLAALRDVDNFARCKLGGRNPLAETPEWTALFMQAKQGGQGESAVGEDSGFCDRLKAAGGRIFVDTDVSVGHIDKTILTAEKLKEQLEKQERNGKLAVGVRG